MKNTVFPYIFKALLCPLVLFTSCSMEETAPVEAARNNEIKVNVTASENPVATKTTFDGQTLVWSGNETMSVLIGDENSTSKDKTSSSLLVFEPANCTFTGVVSLGEFDESDMRAVTVPANHIGSSDSAITFCICCEILVFPSLEALFHKSKIYGII